jgi:hypothetical protein
LKNELISKYISKNENVAMKQLKDKDYALRNEHNKLPIFLVGIVINLDKNFGNIRCVTNLSCEEFKNKI